MPRRLALASLFSTPLASAYMYEAAGQRPLEPHGHCPPFNNSTLMLRQFEAYPQNAVWDSVHCLLYIS